MGSMDDNIQAQHNKERPHQWMAPLITLDTRLYMVYFPRTARSIRFPVGDCEGRATTRTNLRIDFMHRHVRDAVVILEEGKRPHPC